MLFYVDHFHLHIQVDIKWVWFLKALRDLLMLLLFLESFSDELIILITLQLVSASGLSFHQEISAPNRQSWHITEFSHFHRWLTSHLMWQCSMWAALGDASGDDWVGLLPDRWGSHLVSHGWIYLGQWSDWTPLSLKQLSCNTFTSSTL